ncbi:MAG: hypothetical protein AABX00_01200, partial [Nanoarchaeota archaeon]
DLKVGELNPSARYARINDTKIITHFTSSEGWLYASLNHSLAKKVISIIEAKDIAFFNFSLFIFNFTFSIDTLQQGDLFLSS